MNMVSWCGPCSKPSLEEATKKRPCAHFFLRFMVMSAERTNEHLLAFALGPQNCVWGGGGGGVFWPKTVPCQPFHKWPGGGGLYFHGPFRCVSEQFGPFATVQSTGPVTTKSMFPGSFMVPCLP